ncbi:MAG: hypothetical protein ACRD1B_00435 [Thermoanaerobaculia bacterium]
MRRALGPGRESSTARVVSVLMVAASIVASGACSRRPEAGPPTGKSASISVFAATVPNPGPPVGAAPEDMMWIPGGEFSMFAKFVKATGYVAVAERKPRAEDFPGAPPENLVAGSMPWLPAERAGNGPVGNETAKHTMAKTLRHPTVVAALLTVFHATAMAQTDSGLYRPLTLAPAAVGTDTPAAAALPACAMTSTRSSSIRRGSWREPVCKAR